MREFLRARLSVPSFFVVCASSFVLSACGDLSSSESNLEQANHPFASAPLTAVSLTSEDQLDVPPTERGKVLGDDQGQDEESLFGTLGDLKSYIRYQKSHKTVSNIVGTVAIFGGFSTCTKIGPFGSQIYERALKLLWKKAKDGQFYRVVASCFGKSGKYVYYVSSSDLDTVRWGVPADVAAIVNYETSFARDSSTFVFGHSYGGWLALRTALDLPKAINIKGLVSIDPISRTFCTPSIFINAYLSSILSYHPDADCTQAPRDFGDVQTVRLKERSAWWYNFYQDNAGYVHSGYISNATNKYIDYNYTGVFDLGRAHMEIDNDERVWSFFESKI